MGTRRSHCPSSLSCRPQGSSLWPDPWVPVPLELSWEHAHSVYLRAWGAVDRALLDLREQSPGCLCAEEDVRVCVSQCFDQRYAAVIRERLGSVIRLLQGTAWAFTFCLRPQLDWKLPLHDQTLTLASAKGNSKVRKRSHGIKAGGSVLKSTTPRWRAFVKTNRKKCKFRWQWKMNFESDHFLAKVYLYFQQVFHWFLQNTRKERSFFLVSLGSAYSPDWVNLLFKTRPSPQLTGHENWLPQGL